MLEHRIAEMMAEERIQHAQEQAEKDRLARANLPSATPFPQRLAVALGNLLIAAGTVIQKHYEPIQPIPSETDCAPC